MLRNITVLTASNRTKANSPGLAAFASHVIKEIYPDAEISHISATKPFDVLNTPIDDKPPMMIKKSEDYHNETIREYSKSIAASGAFVFVVPEYNSYPPGAMKIMLDHLFNEWSHKPSVVVAFGGGSKGKNALEAMKVILKKVHSKVVEGITIGLPKEYISGEKRLSVPYSEEADPLLKAYLPQLKDAFKKLQQ